MSETTMVACSHPQERRKFLYTNDYHGEEFDEDVYKCLDCGDKVKVLRHPDGFTREHIVMLREAAGYIRRAAEGEGDYYARHDFEKPPKDVDGPLSHGPSGDDIANVLDAIADLLKPLLPPTS